MIVVDASVLAVALGVMDRRPARQRFVVTEGTVKAHVTHIYRKPRAANRAEAVHQYMRLLDLDHR